MKELILSIILAGTLPAANPAPKPPMGWNSFDSYGVYLSEEAAYRNVDAMVDALQRHGYEYFVVDNGWFGEYVLQEGSRYPAEKHASDVHINEYGLLQPSRTYFPGGMKKLADYVHARGLKFGLHIMRGIPRKAVRQNTPIKGTPYKAADIADKANICIQLRNRHGQAGSPGILRFVDRATGRMGCGLH